MSIILEGKTIYMDKIENELRSILRIKICGRNNSIMGKIYECIAMHRLVNIFICVGFFLGKYSYQNAIT